HLKEPKISVVAHFFRVVHNERLCPVGFVKHSHYRWIKNEPNRTKNIVPCFTAPLRRDRPFAAQPSRVYDVQDIRARGGIPVRSWSAAREAPAARLRSLQGTTSRCEGVS